MSRRVVPLLAIAFSLIAVSGCTGTNIFFDSPTGGMGIIAVNFEPELNSIYSGESTTFMLKIKNMGSFAASGTAKMDLLEWDGECQTMPVKQFIGLIAPNTELGTEGEEATFTWMCTAPMIEREGSVGLHIPYEPRVVITTHGAKSITSKSVTLLPTKELLDLTNSGNALPSELVSKSDSQVDIDVKITGPIRLRKDTNSILFPVTITVTNVGGGIVEGSKVNLKVEPGSGLSILTSGECDFSSGLHLWRGRSQSVTCEMSANNVQTLTQARIVVTATYDYTTTATTKIEVIGQKRALWPN